MIMTQPEFQEEMNKYKLGESDKTLLSKFYEIIANLINNVASKITNVELKQGKITSEAIGSVVKLIQEKSKPQVQTQPTTTQEIFTTKVDQFTYTYNPVTKQVIHNAKSGDKVETNETQINKVLAAYGKANNFETKVFNKQEYVKVDNKVLNVNTGSRVTQKEILDLFTTQEVKTKPVVNYETEVYNTLKALEDAEFNVNDVSPETIASEDFSKYPKTLEYLIQVM